MALNNIPIKKEYRSLIDNVVQDFYLPLLSEACLYQRAVGFFSSSSLIELSKGISSLVKNGGKIQIVASPKMTEDDYDAIHKGYEMRDVIENALLRELETEQLDYFSSARLNLLANLVASKTLDIKIAITKNKNDIGIYHEKMGVITDKQGNAVAFSGSMNETHTAMSLNYETIDVFCSWGNEDEKERVVLKQQAFNSIWENTEKEIEILDFPNVTKRIIEKYKDSDPNIDIDREQFVPVKTPPTVPGPSTIKNHPQIPEDVDLHDYQKDAISVWSGENYRGIFDMATGTGKTYTGLGAIVKLSEDLKGNLAVIIVCPFQHLVDQWVEDIIKFNIKPIIGYSSSPQKNWKSSLKTAIALQKATPNKKFVCFVTTNATFSSDYVQGLIDTISSPILLVVDEAHNFGAKSYSKLLDDRFQYRLALSATLERHRDPEGTKALLDFFGRKCIEYDLERAINEHNLTPYKYYPVLVFLNGEELDKYEELSYEISKHVIKGKNGQIKLDKYGEIKAIERSRVVAAAAVKLTKLVETITPYVDEHFLLIYCGATNVSDPKSDSSETVDIDIKQINAVTYLLGTKLNMKVSKFTAEESVEERALIKQNFEHGTNLQGIVAIKCLDEGVNIPGIKTAFILASSTNPKEYIQRRGRVLRKSPETGKQYAEIYDFVTLPRPLDQVQGLTVEQMNRDLSLVKRELTRVNEFGRLSMNEIDAKSLIWKICDSYNLPYEFEEYTYEEDYYD